MTRREFVNDGNDLACRLIAASITGLLISLVTGCGSGGQDPADIITITFYGRSQQVRIRPGASVLDAIQSAFSYRKDSTLTSIIDGTSASWRYEVNNIEPDIYAGDYILQDGDRVNLRPI